jgi:hypothetical protein
MVRERERDRQTDRERERVIPNLIKSNKTLIKLYQSSDLVRLLLILTFLVHKKGLKKPILALSN